MSDADIEIADLEEKRTTRVPKRAKSPAKKKPEPSPPPEPIPSPSAGLSEPSQVDSIAADDDSPEPEPAVPPAGQVWESSYDPKWDLPYYFCRATGQREWALPPGAVLKESAAAPANPDPDLDAHDPCNNAIENKIEEIHANIELVMERARRVALVAALHTKNCIPAYASDPYFIDFLKNGNPGDAVAAVEGFFEMIERTKTAAAACAAAGLPNGADTSFFGLYLCTGFGFDAAVAAWARVHESPAEFEIWQRRRAEALQVGEAVRQRWAARPPPRGWVPECGKLHRDFAVCVYKWCPNKCPLTCSYGLCNAHKKFCTALHCPKHGEEKRLLEAERQFEEECYGLSDGGYYDEY